MREPYPVFSGPGNILLLYFFLAFCISAPEGVFTLKDFLYILAGILLLGLPLGSLINVVYHSTWNLLKGYERMSHSGMYYDVYKKKLDKETTLAVHDKILWEIASKDSIEYFRRRWEHYHFSLQIGIISIISVSFPFILGYYFNNIEQISCKLSVYVYCLSLVLFSIVLFKDCKYTSKSIQEYIAQLFKGSEMRLLEALEKEAKEKKDKKTKKSKIRRLIRKIKEK